MKLGFVHHKMRWD